MLNNRILKYKKVKDNALFGTEKKLLEKCNAADKIIFETEKKLKNSIKMATEFKNKIENQKTEVIIIIFMNIYLKTTKIYEINRNLSSIEEENYSLKVRLQESLDLIDESKRIFESKIEEYEKMVNISLIINFLKAILLDFSIER